MKTSRIIVITALIGALVFASSGRSHADPRKHDIGSGGQPTISGSLGGSVFGSPNVLNDLVVTVNFGEVTPINPNSIVKVVVPIAIRSTEQYQVTVSAAASFGASPNSIKASDIGFGIQNFRSLGARATACSANSIINPVFNNDPASSVTINPATGRAQYPSTLATIGASALLINGPVLSVFRNIGEWKRDIDNGRVFDAVFAIKPQFFEPGPFSVTLTFNISTGPNFPCN
ncbi:MAG TPA: hypothetical protein VNN73_00875 [Blastocatellia bacterium]|nr:hypothetical protein [Blastocatellia bacterium]